MPVVVSIRCNWNRCKSWRQRHRCKCSYEVDGNGNGNLIFCFLHEWVVWNRIYFILAIAVAAPLSVNAPYLFTLNPFIATILLPLPVWTNLKRDPVHEAQKCVSFSSNYLQVHSLPYKFRKNNELTFFLATFSSHSVVNALSSSESIIP